MLDVVTFTQYETDLPVSVVFPPESLDQLLHLELNPLGQPGEDCLRLAFHLDDDAQLVMSGEDLRTGLAIEPSTLITVQ